MRDAVAQSQSNALRLALYQVTGDPDVAALRIRPKPVRGGVFSTYVVAEEDVDRLTEAVLDFLRGRPSGAPAPPPPSEPEAHGLMEIFHGGAELSEAELRFGLEELAFDPFPRGVKWRRRPAPETLRDFNVVVIGAGISGLAAAIQLERLGIPYVVIERQAGIGGTWYLNHYPEARVDASSFLYQFKCDQNYPWSEYFATCAETRRYLEHVAERHGVRSKTRLSTELTDARWDDARSRWVLTVRPPDGGTELLHANAVVSASGLFSTPHLPPIPGIESFCGRMFHTTAWDHDYDYAGKRVALIGTGSSGTQVMPALARDASHLTVFQRTPNWIVGTENYKDAITPQVRWLLDRIPYYWNWYCYASFQTTRQLEQVQTYDPEWQAAGGIISERNDKIRAVLTEYIAAKVGDDPELMAKCVPHHAPLVRRLVVDNGFYDALRRDNVELLSGPIDRITPHGIVTRAGLERECDLIVLAAGFEVSRYLWPVAYAGRDGTTLEDLWSRDGARAYLGMTMPGFPNFFMMYGPNAQPRAGGFHSWAETWARYIVRSIAALIESGASSMEVRRDVYDDYNARMDAATEALIWEAEGHSYYVNEHGRSGVNMPWPIHEYHAAVVEPNLGDYVVR